MVDADSAVYVCLVVATLSFCLGHVTGQEVGYAAGYALGRLKEALDSHERV